MTQENSKENQKYLYESIVDRIQDLIMGGEIKAGEKLPPERHMAERFRVSRSCVRQAIQALSQRGILESRQGDGTYVCEPDASVLVDTLAAAILSHGDLLHEVMEFRLLIEPQIAYLAARRISVDELNRLKVIACDQQRKMLAGEEDDILDAAFHRQLCESARNHLIMQIYHTLSSAMDTSRSRFLQSAPRRRASVEGHLKIIDALERKNPQEAFGAMKEHLLEVEKMVFQARDDFEGEEGKDGL